MLGLSRNMREIKQLPAYFLMVLLLGFLYLGYLIFQPYLPTILMAGIFASLFFPIYQWIDKKLKGRPSISALLTVAIFVLIILIPLGNFVALLVKESIETYPLLAQKVANENLNDLLARSIGQVRFFSERFLPFVDLESLNLKKTILDVGASFTQFIIRNANVLLSGTTTFLINLFFMLITMYYLLKDGPYFVEKLVHLTPLSNKYDRKLITKFRDVSKSTIVSSLVTALVQGVLAAIAYLIVGIPAFFLAVATAIASFIPIVGTAIVWLPVAIGLAIAGKWGAAIFIVLWGIVVIGLSDNLVRTKLVQSRSQIHPLIVFFSIFGGIQLWGFLGIFFGPLVLAFLLTVLHIYELEYSNVLEK